MHLQNTSAFNPIQLDEKTKAVPKSIQVLRVGRFQHSEYGSFEITPLTLADMKKNFDNHVRGIDMSFDYYHDSNEDASAWVRALTLSEDGQELWAEVDWTPRATQKLSERELRYFSPDFAFKWQDTESGTVYENVLFGGGLTNRPFVKEMMAIVADEKHLEESNMTELEKAQKKIKDLEASNLKLSEDKIAAEKKLADMPPPAPAAGAAGEEGDEVAGLKKVIADLQALLAKAQSDNATMLAEKNKADAAKMLAEKTSEFNILLSEGKACVAQKESFLKNDMTAFIKLAQPLNPKGQGSSASAAGEEAGSKEKQILKLAEEKRKINPKLTVGDSISQAKKEIEKAI